MPAGSICSDLSQGPADGGWIFAPFGYPQKEKVEIYGESGRKKEEELIISNAFSAQG